MLFLVVVSILRPLFCFSVIDFSPQRRSTSVFTFVLLEIGQVLRTFELQFFTVLSQRAEVKRIHVLTVRFESLVRRRLVLFCGVHEDCI